MSASSPTIDFQARSPGAGASVRATIQRLSFQRRLFRVVQPVAIGLTVALAILCLLGVVDYAFNVSRLLRVAVVVPTFLCVLTDFIYASLSIMRRRRLREMARDVERAASLHENDLVTFTESIESDTGFRVQPYIKARLEHQALRTLEKLDVGVVVPRRNALRSAAALSLVLLTLLALRLVAPAAFAREIRRIVWLEPNQNSTQKPNSDNEAGFVNNVVAIESLRVRVVPPAYSGLSIEEPSGDGPIRALNGSQIEVELQTRGKFEEATLGFGGVTNNMRALGEGRYSGSFVAKVSGAFEARINSAKPDAPSPIVRAIEVYADTPPEARITEPSSDQLLHGVSAAPISVRWNARDDLGIADVVLKYIRSRGEGDAAKFSSGVVPLGRVDHMSPREWQGAAMLDISRLGLQPGDTLVYWLEARDRNPSANNSGRSATLAIAIIAPEPVKLNLGDLGPAEIGRFLLSERMIINHTEKLHAERARIPREEFLRRAQDIAAEQRDFKNSFNDYIKLEGTGEEREDANSIAPGSVEERVQDAEAERTGVHMHGIPDPPSGTPSNVRDMIFAIRAMWDAEDALSVGDTAQALIYERDALTRLKRAQLAVRYVPPVFAQSRPIDLKRRYAGELNEIKTRLEKLSRLPEAKDTKALRASLGEAYAALSDLQATLDVPVTARGGAVARARERALQAANNLATVGGDHAATIAEALGQLRIVETELARLDVGGNADEYAKRVSKSLSLLTQAAANLFAIAEARTRASGGEANSVLPADDSRASDYFLRLNK